MLSPEEISKLIEGAKKARENAFATRSGHKIGACVLTWNGEYFSGCNVESMVSGLGTCAERAALDHAVIHGNYEIKALLTIDEKQIFPCGACLQYLLGFYQVTEKDIEVVSSDLDGNYSSQLLSRLLPHGYLTTRNVEEIKKFGKKS